MSYVFSIDDTGHVPGPCCTKDALQDYFKPIPDRNNMITYWKCTEPYSVPLAQCCRTLIIKCQFQRFNGHEHYLFISFRYCFIVV